MRSVKLLFAVFLLCGAAFAQGVAGDPETGDFIASVSFPATTLDASCGGHNTASPATCSASMTPSAGDTIACDIQQFSFGTVGGYVSDAVNGPYDAVFQGFYDSSTGHWESGFMFANSAGATITPSATTQGSTSGLSISCVAFKGTATSNVLDPGAIAQFNPPVGAGGVGITSTNPNAGTAAAPTNAKEAIFCGMTNIGPTTPTAGSGYTLLTGQTAGPELWPEYQIQTTATSTNCPYTAASDTWIDGLMAFMNAGAATSGVRAWSGHFTDGHGIANNTAVSAANLQTGGYNSVDNSWSCANISTAKWITGSGLPNRLTSIFVNDTLATGASGLAIQHTGTLTTEACTDQLLVNQTGFAEQDFTISQAGYTPSPTGDLCDIASIAGSVAGDDVTPQFVYAVGILTAAGTASGGSTTYTAGTVTLTLASVATATTGGANNGQAVYTGTITGGGSNALMGEQFLIAGFTNSVNNGTYIAVGSSTTTLTLLNSAAVAETHAATAVTGGFGTTNLALGNNLLNGASIIITGFTNGVNNGTFTASASTPNTITVNNASGTAETHAGAAAVGFMFRMELTDTTTTYTSPGVVLTSGTNPYTVKTLLNVTNGGVHTMKIYNATTGALIGTDTVPVSGLAAGGASLINSKFMGQGSCGMTSAVFDYSNLMGSSNGNGYPWPN